MAELKHYAFDAYGTLFDVHSAAARHRESIGDTWERLSNIWRTKQLEYTWVHAAAGRHTTFWATTEQSLDYAIESIGGLPAGLRAELLAAYRELSAYPEVGDVLEQLRARGSKLAILSNGDPDMLSAAIEAAGLSGAFDAVLSVATAQIFKPSMKVYTLATEEFSVPPSAISFQSSNRWDIAGARIFGMRTVWVNRVGRPQEYPEFPADVVVDDLRALVNGTA